MLSSILFVAPFVAAAVAQGSSEAVNTTVIPVSSDSTTVSSTYTYSNGFTSYLTMTNSLGVVTGQPSVVTSQSELPSGVTTQPAVATIPAGLPTGVTYILQNISRSLTSFEVSVGSSTTVVVNSPTGVSITTGGSESGNAESTDSGSSDSDSSATATGGDDASSTASSSAADATSSDSGAASNFKYASAGVLSFGALFFALL